MLLIARSYFLLLVCGTSFPWIVAVPSNAIAAGGLRGHAEEDPTQGRQLEELSRNLYAIPYEPGVTVRVGNDHMTHKPTNKIDMGGTSGGPYKIVAALSGKVMFIEDSHNTNGGCEYNNYVWLAHDNGEWTCYTHMSKDSTSITAGLSVGDYVEVGQTLGIEDTIGCSSENHLHFEVAIPSNLADPIEKVGGWIKGGNLIPRICGISNNMYVAGTTYNVPRVRPGWDEYARHGLLDASFEADFHAAGQCGYRMDWNSGFDDGSGQAAYNVVYHPNESPEVEWFSHHRLTERQLIDKENEYGRIGYKLVHIDVYTVGHSIYYAAIFKKSNAIAETKTYYGLRENDNQSYFNRWTKEGWYANVISATSRNGVLIYAGVYSRTSLGTWYAWWDQTSSQYQDKFDSNARAGRGLIYLKSYLHKGTLYYSSIWSSEQTKTFYGKHGVTGAVYQREFNERTKEGYKTRSVSATAVGGNTLYAAYWDK